MRILVVLAACALPACSSRPDDGARVRGKPGPDFAFPADPAPPLGVRVIDAFPGTRFERPVLLTHAPGDPGHVYVVEQAGRVLRVAREGAAPPEVFLDISDAVRREHNEEGLLGLAFAPDYASSGALYLYYSASDPTRIQISRFRRASEDARADGTDRAAPARAVRADPASEEVLLVVPQPYGNHNGGALAFGPDGHLYAGLGDGGAAGDPLGSGQDLSTLLGAIVRLEVDATGPARIPADNPFVGREDARAEIWAYGFRNPWRFAFDRQTGALWAGDVGQGELEEIDVVQRGGNHGWNLMEGTRPFARVGDEDIAAAGPLVAPVHEYGRDDGFSVTGGHVYRGQDVPALAGAYVFGDYGTGAIWALRLGEDGRVIARDDVAIVPEVSSFGEDARGGLYAVSLRGQVFQLVAAREHPDVPARLSRTGLFVDTRALAPHPRLLPYAPTVELWSDGAAKRRWLVLPEGGRIDASREPWSFPRGTLTVKHFELERDGAPPLRLETRVMVHEHDGWAGYTYRWNAAQTDAELVTQAATAEVTTTRDGTTRTQRWSFPSSADCLRCHTEGYGRVLGIRGSQLAGTETVAAWIDQGLFSHPPGDVARLPRLDDASVPVATRARAYLDVNCALCHHPGGPTPFGQDLRFETELARMNVVGARAGDPLGLPDERRLVPGRAGSSALWARMRRLDEERMPPLASHVVDERALALVQAWIDGMR